MPFDDKGFAETKADPFSLDSLIAWLETKPAAEEYDWLDCNGKCLLSQYVIEAENLKHAWQRENSGLLKYLYDSGTATIALLHPWTFGAALDRARKLRDAR